MKRTIVIPETMRLLPMKTRTFAILNSPSTGSGHPVSKVPHGAQALP